jgi:MFS family permease
MIMSPCITAIGEGLLTTFTPTTGSNHWIGYQFLSGFGVGLGMQSVGLAVQAILPKEDVSTGVAITFFAQQLGGAIFVTVGQTILSTLLVEKLSGLPGLDPMTIVQTGATELHRIVPSQFFGRVIDAYNFAITRIFYCAMALALAQLVTAFFIEWRSIKKPKDAEAAKAAALQGPEE